MIRFTKTFVLVLSALSFAPIASAQTPGSVAFSTKLVSVNGKWGTKHYVVAWVTKEDGTFIKTLWKQGKSFTSSEWTTNCPSWNTARGGSNGSTAFDGYTSATASDYTSAANNPIDPVWNCLDASNNLVPDGNYKFWVQYGHSDATGPLTTNGQLWTKRSTAYSVSYPNTSSFTNMSIAWTPTTVAPTITSSAPPGSGEQGVAYSCTCVATGTAPITFSVTSGALPPPLTLSPAGVISGTPDTAGLFTGTITAANGTAPNATQNFSITIAPAATFHSWAVAAGLGTGADPAATPKGDRVSNLQKFAFNMDASKADIRRLVVGDGGLAGLPGTATDAGPVLRMEYLRRKASTNPGITYTAQFGSDLLGWTTATGTATSIDGSWERVVVVDAPPADSTMRFGRVLVSQP